MKTTLPCVLATVLLCGCSSQSVNCEKEHRALEYSYIFRNWNANAQATLWVPREYYLGMLREARVLTRGLERSAVEQWLGKPDRISDTDGWEYDGGCSMLTVFFQSGKVSKFEQSFEEGPRLHKPEIW